LDAPEEVAQGLDAHEAAALDFNMIPQDLDSRRSCSRFRFLKILMLHKKMLKV
jgi:hypothetical protein